MMSWAGTNAGRMHVCLVCNEYPPCAHGGIGSYSKTLAEGLVGVGCEVSVVGIYQESVLSGRCIRGGHQKLAGVDVFRAPANPPTGFPRLDMLLNRARLYAELKRVHRWRSIDVAEAPEFGGWLPLAAPGEYPLITRLHGGAALYADLLKRPSSRLQGWFERMQVARSELIVAVSEHTGQHSRRVLRTHFPYRVVHNAVSIPAAAPPPAKTGDPLILFSGSIAPRKGVEQLVRAMPLIWERHPRANLVLAGRSGHSVGGVPYEKYLQTLMSEEHSDKVLFLGGLDQETELFPLIGKATVFCLPSHAEAFALAPLEAMARGRPVVYSRACSGPEAVRDGVTGLLVDPSDPADIARAINRLLDDPVLADRLGRAARAEVVLRFGLQDWIKTNYELFEGLIAGYSSGIRQ